MDHSPIPLRRIKSARFLPHGKRVITSQATESLEKTVYSALILCDLSVFAILDNPKPEDRRDGLYFPARKIPPIW